jgi:hypothetical protein
MTHQHPGRAKATRRVITTALLTLSALVGLSCSGGAEPAGNRTLDLAGPLDSAMWRRVSEASWDKIDSIRVQSRGGDPKFAVLIARELKRSGKTINIDGFCASACLMIAVTNNGKVAFSKGSTLTVHNTASSVYYMSLRTYPKIAAAYYRERMTAERAWFVENEIDPRLLLIPQFMIDTPCLEGPETDDPRRYREIFFMAHYSGWIIPPEAAKTFGMRASGWEPHPADAKKRLYGNLEGSGEKRISAETPSLKLLQQNENRLSSALYYAYLCKTVGNTTTR